MQPLMRLEARRQSRAGSSRRHFAANGDAMKENQGNEATHAPPHACRPALLARQLC